MNRFVTAACLVWCAACGANVVFGDAGGGNEGAQGAGGPSHAGGTPSNGGSTTDFVGGSISTGPDCDQLLATFTEVFTKAITCNACIDFDACINGVVIQDTCGCPAGTSDPSLANEAQNAYNQWVGAGCGPFLCDQPCVTSSQWFCTPNGKDCGGFCTPAFAG